jgi:predicted RNase H-like HicB family nuclease
LSGKSRNTSARAKGGAGRGRRSDRVDRPFDPEILRRAREVADAYQIVLWTADGEYYGRGLEMPGAMGDGNTPDECVANTRQAITVAVAAMLEAGEAPPQPASEGARTEQVNIRLTSREKLQLETAATQSGYRGLSEYVRAKALA